MAVNILHSRLEYFFFASRIKICMVSTNLQHAPPNLLPLKFLHAPGWNNAHPAPPLMV
jgi:hypothetical protein